MTEMIMTLVIISVLSIGALMGFSTFKTYHAANQIIRHLNVEHFFIHSENMAEKMTIGETRPGSVQKDAYLEDFNFFIQKIDTELFTIFVEPVNYAVCKRLINALKDDVIIKTNHENNDCTEQNQISVVFEKDTVLPLPDSPPIKTCNPKCEGNYMCDLQTLTCVCNSPAFLVGNDCVRCSQENPLDISESLCSEKCSGIRYFNPITQTCNLNCTYGNALNTDFTCTSCSKMVNAADKTTQAECLKCPNTFWNVGLNTCWSCDWKEQQFSDEANGCHGCSNRFLSNNVNNTKLSVCTPCDYAGTVKTSAANCARCPKRAFNAGTSECYPPCEEGDRLSNGNCSGLCISGSEFLQGNNTCASCSLRTFVLDKDNSCHTCTTPKRYIASSGSCGPCSRMGYADISQAECTHCDAVYITAENGVQGCYNCTNTENLTTTQEVYNTFNAVCNKHRKYSNGTCAYSAN